MTQSLSYAAVALINVKSNDADSGKNYNDKGFYLGVDGVAQLQLQYQIIGVEVYGEQ